MMLRSLIAIALFSMTVVSAATKDVSAAGVANAESEVSAAAVKDVEFDAEVDFEFEAEVDVDFKKESDEDGSYHEHDCACEKHKKEREQRPRVCQRLENDRIPALRVTSPNVNGGNPSYWQTCTWQSITFDASAYPDFKVAHAQLFGGKGFQVNLKCVPSGTGIAKIFVPASLSSGLYRARVILRRYCGEYEAFQEIAAVGPWFQIDYSFNNCQYNK